MQYVATKQEFEQFKLEVGTYVDQLAQAQVQQAPEPAPAAPAVARYVPPGRGASSIFLLLLERSELSQTRELKFWPVAVCRTPRPRAGCR